MKIETYVCNECKKDIKEYIEDGSDVMIRNKFHFTFIVPKANTHFCKNCVLELLKNHFFLDQEATISDETHSTHCCIKHGCKYGDENCPVIIGKVPQRFICGQCRIGK
jgi:hypothetical protein